MQIHIKLFESNSKFFEVSQVVQSELSTHIKHPVPHGSHVGEAGLVFKKKPELHDVQTNKVVWQDIQFVIVEEHKTHEAEKES